jgi:hypothetical protein
MNNMVTLCYRAIFDPTVLLGFHLVRLGRVSVACLALAYIGKMGIMFCTPSVIEMKLSVNMAEFHVHLWLYLV